MFWTAAGMGLPETVAVKLEDGSINYWVVLFFGSYILVLNWTLLQVRCGRLMALVGNRVAGESAAGANCRAGASARNRDVSFGLDNGDPVA